MKCHYDTHHEIQCIGPAIATLHDARGCVDVCIAHAQWRFKISMAFGHSASCKHVENTNGKR